MHHFQVFNDAFSFISLALTPLRDKMLEFTRISICRAAWKEKEMASKQFSEIKLLIIV
jgi:hypothetical protein